MQGVCAPTLAPLAAVLLDVRVVGARPLAAPAVSLQVGQLLALRLLVVGAYDDVMHLEIAWTGRIGARE